MLIQKELVGMSWLWPGCFSVRFRFVYLNADVDVGGENSGAVLPVLSQHQQHYKTTIADHSDGTLSVSSFTL